MADRLFEFTYKYLSTIDKSNTSIILAVKNNLFSFAKSDASLKKLLAWYNGEEEVLKNFDMGLSN